MDDDDQLGPVPNGPRKQRKETRELDLSIPVDNAVNLVSGCDAR